MKKIRLIFTIFGFILLFNSLISSVVAEDVVEIEVVEIEVGFEGDESQVEIEHPVEIVEEEENEELVTEEGEVADEEVDEIEVEEDDPSEFQVRDLTIWDVASDIPSLIEEGDPDFLDFHNVATNAQLATAVSGAPTDGSVRVINVTSNLAFGATALSAANGRDITAGRNIVIQSNVGVNLTATTVRHFNVTGAASRLIVNEGITIRRVADPGTTLGGAVGGGITLASGTLRLNGGRLHGLANNANTGTAVHQTGGTFEMFAGEISYNRNTNVTIGTFGAIARGGGAGLRMNAGVFNFHGGVFHNNRTPASGGAILISSNGSTMNMFGGLIYNNMNGGGGTLEGTTPGSTATGQGAGALGITGGGNFNMFGGEFRDNFTVGTGGDGGAIESGSSVAGAAGRNSINLFGGRFSGNIGRQGGAINNHHNSDLLIGDPTTVPFSNVHGYAAVRDYLSTGVIFENNVARGTGGAIAQRGDTATLTMNGGVLRDNQSVGSINEGGFPGGSGGAIFINTGSMTMNGGVIEENIAQNNVAGIVAANTLQGGGGIYVGAGTTLIMNDGIIRYNETGTRQGSEGFGTSGGAGIHNRGALELNSGDIHGNISGHTAATSGGGGIHLGAGTFTMGEVRIRDNNSASTGGGIEMMTTGTLLMTTGEIINNVATGAGGGINVNPSLSTAGAATITAAATAMPTLTITGGTIEGNIAGITVGEQVNFAPSRIVPSPTTAGNGLTLPANTMTIGGNAVINGNVHYGLNFSLTRAGAGAMTTPVQTFTIGGNAVIDGHVTVAPTLTSAGAGTAARTMTHTFNLIENAQVLNGLSFRPTVSQSRSAGTTTFNTNTNFNVSGSSTITGGLNLSPELTTTNTGTTAFNNINTFTFTATGSPTIIGGVDVTPGLTHSGGTGGTAANSSRVNTINFNMSGGTIEGGVPRENGGALNYQPILNAAGGTAATVRANNSNFNLDSGTVQNGVAIHHGGGIYHLPTSSITAAGTHNINARMRNFNIVNNRAGTSGGGIFMDFILTGATTPAPTFNLSEVGAFTRNISNNFAQQHGGGIYVAHQMGGTGFTTNSISNAVINYNQASSGYGGGIYVEVLPDLLHANETFTLINSSISGNTSAHDGASMWLPHVANMTIENSNLDHNTTETGDGGGLHFSPIGPEGTRTLRLEGASTVNHNSAPRGYGGAIHLGSDSNLYVGNGAEISDNQAIRGGGIDITSGEATIHESEIGNNHATENGGGIYVSESGLLQLINTTITNNHAESHGGGIFTENYEYDVGTLSPSTYSNVEVADAYFNNNTAGTGTFTSPELNGQEITAINLSIGDPENDNPLNNYDINFEGERQTFQFSFIKMDSEHEQVLQNAEFELHTYLEGEWILIATAASAADGRVEFGDLRPGVTYRLVETSAPYGYRIPEGHWLVEISETEEITIIAEGNLVPAFRIENDTYFLGNLLEFDLPLLGGLGINSRVVATGLFMTLIACSLVLIVRRHRKVYN